MAHFLKNILLVILEPPLPPALVRRMHDDGVRMRGGSVAVDDDVLLSALSDTRLT